MSELNTSREALEQAKQTKLTIGDLACVLVNDKPPMLVYFSDDYRSKAVDEMIADDDLAKRPRRVSSASEESPISQALAKRGDKTVGHVANDLQRRTEILGIWPESQLEEAVAVTGMAQRIWEIGKD
jgi:hypothetical protein